MMEFIVLTAVFLAASIFAFVVMIILSHLWWDKEV
jgi:hypothetical protein